MTKSELCTMIREMINEELDKVNKDNELKEAVEGPGYVIRVWDRPENKKSGMPSYDSIKAGKKYADFDEVLAVLRSSEFSEKGAYEITWIKTDESIG